MKPISEIRDGRIGCKNILYEMTIGEYLAIAEDILAKNEFQRKRVAGAKSVYALLKEDLIKGCVIPPIILASKSLPTSRKTKPNLKRTKESVLILDGLQRTHTIIDIRNDLQKNPEGLAKFMKHKIRCEFYVGIDRIGILYRMLTLNTGQTPMSLRQQIEMLYLDIESGGQPVKGIRLVREAESGRARGDRDYKLRDAVDGFNSFLERNELPLDRADLLENIKSLNNLSKEDSKTDVFWEWVKTADKMIQAFKELLGEAELGPDYLERSEQVWGKDSLEVFKKSQAITGFGAAVGRLKDIGAQASFADVRKSLQVLQLTGGPVRFLESFNDKMMDIAKRAKKIGNSQRLFFGYYFRELLNPETDAYLDVMGAIEPAFRKFESQTF